MTVLKSDGNLEQCQSEFVESHADVRKNSGTYRNCQFDPEATLKPITIVSMEHPRSKCRSQILRPVLKIQRP